MRDYLFSPGEYEDGALGGSGSYAGALSASAAEEKQESIIALSSFFRRGGLHISLHDYPLPATIF